jgi:hypothetical protein
MCCSIEGVVISGKVVALMGRVHSGPLV